MSGKRILIAAGGTGGHMFPARAAVEALIARGWTVRLVTDGRGARHARDFPGAGVDEVAAASPFVKNPVKLVSALWQLNRGMGQAGLLIAEFQPDIVAGFGGYPAFPTMIAALRAGIPILIHEQNAVLGRVNRLFSGRAAVVASGFDRLDRISAKAHHAVTGNPVRAQVLTARDQPYAPVGADGPIRVFVVGGSLGARILSEQVPAAIALLPAAIRRRLDVVQQTRPENLDQARDAYARAGVKAVCEAFFDDMDRQYARAHLVIARAGASTVAEIAAVGRPAIFVPLAIAMDDHQTANAQALVDAGAAIRLTELELTPQVLCQHLETLLADGEALARRADAARAVGKPDAHERLADLIEHYAKD